VSSLGSAAVRLRSEPRAPRSARRGRAVDAPGAGTAVGAITGAILGAAIAGPREAGAGLLLGGITGAAIGSASDANAQAQANVEQARINSYAASGAAGAWNYRRAISACLDARGYTTA